MRFKPDFMNASCRKRKGRLDDIGEIFLLAYEYTSTKKATVSLLTTEIYLDVSRYYVYSHCYILNQLSSELIDKKFVCKQMKSEILNL